jgi:hypothetical protein
LATIVFVVHLRRSATLAQRRQFSEGLTLAVIIDMRSSRSGAQWDFCATLGVASSVVTISVTEFSGEAREARKTGAFRGNIGSPRKTKMRTLRAGLSSCETK